ncbi:MAG: TetR family transcriptional regulator [Gordonia sp. (in: high G+C Gram-positive bacteria)]
MEAAKMVDVAKNVGTAKKVEEVTIVGAGKKPETLRADAQENYERILAAATELINREGNKVSLSAIAAAAGVGIGTLYRRFPTRPHLIEAVYRGRVVELCDSATGMLADSETTVEAMRCWLNTLIAMLIRDRGVDRTLATVLAQDSSFRTDTRNGLVTAVNLFLDEGVRNGTLRDGVEAIDILRTATGIAYVSRDLADTVGPLELLLDGLRYGTSHP